MKTKMSIGADFFERFWEKSFTPIKTVLDVRGGAILVLDKDLRVIAANEPFYRTFQVEPKDTEGKFVYELGNGQWDIPALRKLLEDILPKNTSFNGFEVTHNFPSIGQRVMILNGRWIYVKEDTAREVSPPVILLAIDDVTEMMAVADALVSHTTELEAKLGGRT